MDCIYLRNFVWYSIVCQCDKLVFFISVDHNNDPIGIILYNTWAPKMSSKLVVIVASTHVSHCMCYNIQPYDIGPLAWPRDRYTGTNIKNCELITVKLSLGNLEMNEWQINMTYSSTKPPLNMMATNPKCNDKL